MTPSDGLGCRSNMRLLQFKDDTPCAEGFKNSGPKNLGNGRALRRSCARWKSRTPILLRACVVARLTGGNGAAPRPASDLRPPTLALIHMVDQPGQIWALDNMHFHPQSLPVAGTSRLNGRSPDPFVQD